MNLRGEEILRFLEASKRGSADVAEIAAHVGFRTADDEQANYEIQQLVSLGLLRQENARYSVTEDARLVLSGPRDLTLYTRPGCHLCDMAKAKMLPLLRTYGASMREVNIDDDEILRARYDVEVPVLFLGARKIAKFHVDVEQLERQLARAEK